MLELGDSGGFFTRNDVYDVVFLKLLLDGLNNVKHQLDLVLCIHFRLGVQAVVAVATVLLRIVFTEIVEQVFASARCGFSI